MIFYPQGGMNQDDSIVTPTRNAAGRNAFNLGDYKYALNARIGSSRSDNFGDLETIKGTTEVTNYYVREQLFENPSFAGSMDGWSTYDNGEPGDWTYVSDCVVVSPESGDIIYQPVSVVNRRVRVRIDYAIPAATVSGLAIYIAYMNGAEIIDQALLTNETSDSEISRFFDVDLPIGCDGVGLSAVGEAVGISIFTLFEFDVYGWEEGSKPAGDERVVGKREDKETNRLYYCVYNSEGEHCIRYYDPSYNGVFELLRWSGLNFQETGFVSMAIIDKWLGLTDRYNRPRLMNVDTISDLYDALTSDSLPDNYFREYHISFHKWAPVMPPVLKVYYDGTDNYEKFRNKVYQWSYRYVYRNNLRSRYSPISNVAQSFIGQSTGFQITGIDIYIPGFNFDEPNSSNQYNYFTNNDLKFTEAVEYIEIVYRESPDDVWRIFKRHEVEFAINNQEFQFTGESNSTPVSIDDFSQLFDVVPLKAGTIETIDNRFVFGDILEEESVAAPVQVESVGVVSMSGSVSNSENFLFGSSDSSDNSSVYGGMSNDDADELGFRNNICQTTFKGRGRYKLGIQWLGLNGWRSAAYTSDDWIYEIPEETSVIEKIYALTFSFPVGFTPPDWAVAYQIMRTNCLNIDYFMFGACNMIDPLIDDPSQSLDNLEVSQAIQDRIRQHFENQRLITGTDYDKFLEGLAKNPFRRPIVSQIRKTAAAGSVSDASRLYINVNNWYNSSKRNSGGTQNNPMNDLYYNFREGDRVRFLASTTATPTDEQKQVYDVEILEYTGRGLVVKKPEGILWVPGDNANTDPADRIIEVYTPRIANQADYVFYETGEWYPVLYPMTSLREMSKREWLYDGINDNVTCDTYGQIKVFNNRPFVFGDCHAINKSLYYDRATTDASFVTSIKTASMNCDKEKTYDTWQKNNGRPSPAYTNLPVVQFKTTQVRFGGQAIEESFVNNLNRFREQDQKIYPSEYGRIRALVNTANAQVESVGAILLAIGERETFSIYVNRQTLEDLSGRTQVALSDRVLGSYNTLLGSHGTLNPESVSIDRGRVYYWDAMDGCWIRYGRDGLTEISFYKMRNWFRELGGLLINEYYSGDLPVALSEFDPFNEELITLLNHDSLPSTFRDYASYKGCLFSEEDKRWKSCHSYSGEMFGRINNQVVIFVNGNVHLLETSDTRSTFVGTKYDVMIEPVFCAEGVNISWQNISLLSTHRWSVERFLSEYRGAKPKQQSSIGLNEFDVKEDNFYAALKNNVNTVNKVNPIITGDKMRSKAIRALLKLDPEVVIESLLHYVSMNGIDSPKNP